MESHWEALQLQRNCASALRTDDPYAFTPVSLKAIRQTGLPRLFGAAGHNSASVAPSVHLPLSKVNREVRSACGQKSRPEGGFKGGIWEGSLRSRRPFRLLLGFVVH